MFGSSPDERHHVVQHLDGSGRSVSWICAAVIWVTVLVACGGSKGGDATAELRQLRDQMCNCKDRTCTEGIAAKTRAFSDTYKASSPTPAQMKAIAIVFDDLTACRSKVTGLSAADLEAGDAADDLVGQMAAIKDELCLCKDAACARHADAKLTALATSDQGATLTSGMKFAAAPVLDEMKKCRLRLTGHAEMAGAADDALDELTALKDEMCACSDKACAERVTEEMMKMGEKHKDTKATESQMKAAAAITEDLTKCMSRAMGL